MHLKTNNRGICDSVERYECDEVGNLCRKTKKTDDERKGTMISNRKRVTKTWVSTYQHSKHSVDFLTTKIKKSLE